MAREMSDLLHLFLDLYDKSPQTLEFLLTQPNPFGLLTDLNDDISHRDQYQMLLDAHRKTTNEILAKTLIQTTADAFMHCNLRDVLTNQGINPNGIVGLEAAYEALPQITIGPDLMELWDGTMESAISLMAAAHGMSVLEFATKLRADHFREQLSAKKLDSELLRFFADRIDQISDAIEKLDGTEFDRVIPEPLHVPFRELHINFVLGNYGTTLILCGALLERALQDLLQSGSLLNDLIRDAKKAGIVAGHNNRFADHIRDERNAAAHGKVRFSDIPSKRAWETIIFTRTIVSALYKDKLN